MLAAGAVLKFERPRIGQTHRAVVTDAGGIKLEDGQEFRSPSRAAAVAADIPAMDGWHAWVVDSSRRSLDFLRQEFLDQVAARPAGEAEDVPTPLRAHEFLKDARSRADANDPVEISVRDLLTLWTAKSRGHRISQRIEADLANHGLITSPSFRAVTPDAAVRLVTAPLESGTSGAALADASDAEELDVGLTVGNLPSALGGVASVAPTATFEEAITQMLLNDYSQLAVLSGAHTLRGAVTWKSIAQARHASPSPSFSDAIIRAHEARYNQELIDVLTTLEASDFVFVRDEKNVIAGIVTTADVVHAYGELATPFFLLGELDQTLRHVISRTFTLEEVISLCDTDGTRSIHSFDDLDMGDYQRSLENPGSWAKLGWPLDRVAFVKRLDELRSVRNDVMHFNRDPVPADSVDKLRNILRMLRQYCD
jgi:CBS domain-containing protein